MRRNILALLRTFVFAAFVPALAFSLVACEPEMENDTEVVENGDSEDDSMDNSKGPVCKAVDLGLSVKWASCNVGAESPEEYGNYYAWGETEEKSNYTWDTYVGTSYDAASVILKGDWRLPTREEFLELIEKCIWVWTTRGGICGHLITGSNGNSIFLPATGNITGKEQGYVGFCGNYWSSTLGPDNAYFLYFEENLKVCIDYTERCWGRTIRAVTD